MSVEIRRLVLSERVFGFRFFTAVLLTSLVWLVLPAQALVYWRADYNDLPNPNLETPYEQCMARINKNADEKPTAAVIAPNFILTAAHWGNLAYYNYKVSLGTEDRHNYRIFA